MDLSIFEIEDKSGKYSKESFLQKNHIDEYNYVVNWCISNNIEGIPFKEKVYLAVNKFKDVPKCKNINCTNKVKFKNSTLGYYDYCSNKCISSDPIIKQIKEQKSLDKFGTKAPAQSSLIKDKIIKTNNLKYGSNSPLQNRNINSKSKNTLLKNWGVDNPSKNKEILEKRVNSFKDNIEQYKESFKKTSIEKYGVEHHWMIVDIHKKSIDFFYKNYKERIISKLVNINTNKVFIDFNKNDKTSLIFNCGKCNTDFNILTYQFYWRINNNKDICTNCYPISENSSISQIEVYNFIEKHYNNLIIQNDRESISPYEIDIFLPNLKIGFEFNGLYWHSDKFKNVNYHLDKYNYSNNNGIKLINIWEDDWNFKREICESVILNRIGKSDKLWARKTTIKMVSYNDSRKFLDSNHLQGDCKSSVRIGLYYNNKLVSLMTFSKLRISVGGKHKENFWELTRFCNILNISVVGGASKLLNFFIKEYNPIEIHSYSDNMISDGKLYEKLNFKLSHTSKPSYWYVINNIRQHRFNWTKDKLVKMGYDKNKFEHEIMEEMGYLRVWSAGNKKWVWYKKSPN
jgi:hypothetical protein